MFIFPCRYPCHLASELADEPFALFWRKHAKPIYAEFKKDFVKAPTSAEEWDSAGNFTRGGIFRTVLVYIFKANWSPGYHDNTLLLGGHINFYYSVI